MNIKRFIAAFTAMAITAGMIPQTVIAQESEAPKGASEFPVVDETLFDTTAEWNGYDGEIGPVSTLTDDTVANYYWLDKHAGTEDDPYEITSAADMLGWANLAQQGDNHREGIITGYPKKAFNVNTTNYPTITDETLTYFCDNPYGVFTYTFNVTYGTNTIYAYPNAEQVSGGFYDGMYVKKWYEEPDGIITSTVTGYTVTITCGNVSQTFDLLSELYQLVPSRLEYGYSDGYFTEYNEPVANYSILYGSWYCKEEQEALMERYINKNASLSISDNMELQIKLKNDNDERLITLAALKDTKFRKDIIMKNAAGEAYVYDWDSQTPFYVTDLSKFTSYHVSNFAEYADKDDGWSLSEFDYKYRNYIRSGLATRTRPYNNNTSGTTIPEYTIFEDETNEIKGTYIFKNLNKPQTIELRDHVDWLGSIDFHQKYKIRVTAEVPEQNKLVLRIYCKDLINTMSTEDLVYEKSYSTTLTGSYKNYINLSLLKISVQSTDYHTLSNRETADEGRYLQITPYKSRPGYSSVRSAGNIKLYLPHTGYYVPEDGTIITSLETNVEDSFSFDKYQEYDYILPPTEGQTAMYYTTLDQYIADFKAKDYSYTTGDVNPIIMPSIDVSFSGKYFRLTSNIDFAQNTLFPEQIVDDYGFDGTLDLNGHILYTCTPAKHLFGDILENGCLKNGCIVQTWIKDPKSAENRLITGNCAIGNNAGLVDNVLFADEGAFTHSAKDESWRYYMSETGGIAYNKQKGIMQNCKAVYLPSVGSLCIGNDGLIDNCSMIIDTTLSQTGPSYLQTILCSSGTGIIRNSEFKTNSSDKPIAKRAALPNCNLENCKIYIKSEALDGTLISASNCEFAIAVSNAYSSTYFNKGIYTSCSIYVSTYGNFTYSGCDFIDCNVINIGHGQSHDYCNFPNLIKGGIFVAYGSWPYMYGRGSGSIIDAKVYIKSIIRPNYGVGTLDNSELNIDISEQESRSSNDIMLHSIYATDSTINIIDNSSELPNYSIRFEKFDNSTLNADKLLIDSNGQMIGYPSRLDSSNINVVELYQPSTTYPRNSIIDSCYMRNCNINIEKSYGVNNFLPAKFINSVFKINIMSAPVQNDRCVVDCEWSNSEIYITTDASYADEKDPFDFFYTEPNSEGTLTNCYLYYDNKSPAKNHRGLWLSHHVYTPANMNNVTIVIPHANVSASNTAGEYFAIGSEKSGIKGSDINIFANLKCDDTVKQVIGTRLEAMPVTKNVNLLLNITDENGSVNIPTHGYMPAYTGSDSVYYNIAFMTNSTASDQSFMYFQNNLNGIGADSALFKDKQTLCQVVNVFYSTGALSWNNERGEDIENVIPGLIGGHGVGTRMMKDRIVLSNIFIRDDMNAVYEEYHSDPSISDDINPWSEATLWTDTNWEDYLFDTDPAYIKRYTTEDTQSGKLAYLLDNGSNYRRRTYNWTVQDPIKFTDPDTGDVMLSVPAHTATGSLYLPRHMSSIDNNRGSVFKASVTNNERGSVTLNGINGSGTDTVYAKANTDVLGDIMPESGNILVNLKQSLNSSIFAEISDPDTYRMPTADVEFNGYFAEPHTITVDMDTTHASLTPSKTVTGATDLVKLSVTANEGYYVTNIAANGVPVTGRSFVMPDADVVITADVVELDGGITKFSLLGYQGIIDQDEGTIDVTIPTTGNITNLKPTIEWVGDSISPSADMRCDFSEPIVYTVKYGSLEKHYFVTVRQTEYTMRIYEFSLAGVKGDINQITHTITVTAPNGIDLSNIAPDNISYSAQSISPSETTAQDFRSGVAYTLYADGMSPVSYIINVKTVDDSDAYLQEFKISGYNGVIDNANLTVTLTVPSALDLSNVQPDIVRYSGKQITPAKTAYVDLENVDYTVTNQLDEPKTYDVIINRLPRSSTATIDKFALGDYEGVIDQENKTITVTIPDTVDVSNTVPSTLDYTAKSIYPSVDSEHDFTLPVEYTVIADDNTEVTYTVNVVTTSSACDLLEYSILGFPGIIDQDAQTVLVNLPYGIDVTHLKPSSLTISDGATIDPTIDDVLNFTDPKTYKVTSESGTAHKDYVVTVTTNPDYDNVITKFTLYGTDGTIANIGSDYGLIEVTLYGKYDVSNAVPDIILYSEGAALNPAADTARDFTQENVTYDVTGKLDGKRTYDVIVTVITPDKIAEITSYIVDGTSGVIDQTTGKITVTMPDGYTGDLTNVTPDITWRGDHIIPGADTVIDLTTPKTYTVYAEDPDVSKTYTVTVIIPEKPDVPVEQTYAVIVKPSEGGQITYSPATAKHKAGDKITLFAAADADYTFEKYVIDGSETTNAVFTMSNHDVTVSGVFTEKTPTPPAPPAPDPYMITAYSALGTTGNIDQTKLTITLELPTTLKGKTNNIVPDRIEWTGANLTPSESDRVNLEDGLTYTVSNVKGDSKTYTIKIKWESKPDKPNPPRPVSDPYILTCYKALGIEGKIDQDRLNITMDIPLSLKAKTSDVIPDSIVWLGKTLTPSENSHVNLVDGLQYTVYNKAGSSKTYTVHINWVNDLPEPSSDCIITAYKALGIDGIIDQNALTITMNVPDSLKNSVANIVPDAIEWRGILLNPSEINTVTLRDGLQYTVYAENNSSKTYTIKLNWINDDEPSTEEPNTEEPSTETPDEPDTSETVDAPSVEVPDTEEPDDTREPVVPDTDEPGLIPDDTDEPDDATDEPDDPGENPHTGTTGVIPMIGTFGIAASAIVISRRKKKK